MMKRSELEEQELAEKELTRVPPGLDRLRDLTMVTMLTRKPGETGPVAKAERVAVNAKAEGERKKRRKKNKANKAARKARRVNR